MISTFSESLLRKPMQKLCSSWPYYAVHYTIVIIIRALPGKFGIFFSNIRPPNRFSSQISDGIFYGLHTHSCPVSYAMWFLVEFRPIKTSVWQGLLKFCNFSSICDYLVGSLQHQIAVSHHDQTCFHFSPTGPFLSAYISPGIQL